MSNLVIAEPAPLSSPPDLHIEHVSPPPTDRTATSRSVVSSHRDVGSATPSRLPVPDATIRVVSVGESANSVTPLKPLPVITFGGPPLILTSNTTSRSNPEDVDRKFGRSGAETVRTLQISVPKAKDAGTSTPSPAEAPPRPGAPPMQPQNWPGIVYDGSTLVTIQGEAAAVLKNAEKHLQAILKVGRTAKENTVPRIPRSITPAAEDDILPSPPALRAQNDGEGLGLGKELFNLRLNQSNFVSAFSKYDSTDVDGDEMLLDGRDIARAERPGGRKSNRLRLHDDGTLRCGSVVITEWGITSPSLYSNHLPPALTPLHAFRSTFIRLEVLGRGASGEVYKAVHVPSLTLVAVKSIYYNDVSHHHDFESELLSMCANQTPLWDPRSKSDKKKDEFSPVEPPCPHLVTFHDAFMDTREDALVMVMEYMDAGSLQDIVDTGGCISESVIANIAFQLLSALAYLHDKRILHRDIKPANILLNHYGQVKLSDFGVAVSVPADKHGVKSNLGSTAFQSPERLNGYEYSFPADVWSLGISLVCVLTGSFPVPQRYTKSYFALLDYFERFEVPIPATASPDLQSFLSRMLQKDSEKRWSAAQLLRHPFIVEKVTNGGTIESRLTSPDCLASRASMADLRKIALKVQKYRVRAAIYKQIYPIPLIPPPRFETIAAQLSLPVAVVAQDFNACQRMIEDRYKSRAAAAAQT